MRTWDALPSEHWRPELRRLKRIAENAELALAGALTRGPSVSRPDWQAELYRMDAEINRCWADWGALLFQPLNDADPIVCEEVESCPICP